MQYMERVGFTELGCAGECAHSWVFNSRLHVSGSSGSRLAGAVLVAPSPSAQRWQRPSPCCAKLQEECRVLLQQAKRPCPCIAGAAGWVAVSLCPGSRTAKADPPPPAGVVWCLFSSSHRLSTESITPVSSEDERGG